MHKMKISLILLVIFSTCISINAVYAQTNYEIPKWFMSTADWWMDDEISDKEFTSAVNYLIKEEILLVPENSIINTSDIPDWLLNNAGWWHARIFTNSDFASFDKSYINERILLFSGGAWGDDPEYRQYHLPTPVNYTSHGFRTNIPSSVWDKKLSPEISIQKPENTYRIFAVGGSVTYGVILDNHETWPAILEKKFDQMNLNFNVEVINAGINGADTSTEIKLIEDKLVNFNPDMIIMYDGWNDMLQSNEIQPLIYPNGTIQNWQTVCELGHEKNFKTVIILQPVTGIGNRILTNQEQNALDNTRPESFYFKKRVLDSIPLIAKNLHQLNESCTKVLDFTNIFDYIQAPIYFDAGHYGLLGTQILVKNIFTEILPIISPYQTFNQTLEYDSGSDIVIFAHSSDLSGKNFNGMNLTNAVFYKTNLSNASFRNADLTGVILKGANLTGVNLSEIDLSGKDLRGTILRGVDLSDNDLTNTILAGADLTNAILRGVDLSGKDLRGTILDGVDLSDTDLTGAMLKDPEVPLQDQIVQSIEKIWKKIEYRIMNIINMS